MSIELNAFEQEYDYLSILGYEQDATGAATTDTADTGAGATTDTPTETPPEDNSGNFVIEPNTEILLGSGKAIVQGLVSGVIFALILRYMRWV